MAHRPLYRALPALALLAAVAAPAAAYDHLSGGEKGTLRIEFELKGKEDGRPIHRTVVMVLRMESDDSFDWADDEDTAALAGAAARRERAVAAASTGVKTVDEEAVARACRRDENGHECIAGQKALADALMQVDSAMRTGIEDAGASAGFKDRGHSWHGLMAGGACGSIEGRLLDPGARGGVTRIPSGANDGASVKTCLHRIMVDRKSGTARFLLSPFEVERPDRKERGYYLIEDFDLVGADGATGHDQVLRHIPFKGNRPSGSASYRGPRGITTMRWTFERG